MAEQSNEQRGFLGFLLAIVAAFFLVPWTDGGTSSGPARSAESVAPEEERPADAIDVNDPAGRLRTPLLTYLGIEESKGRCAVETAQLIRTEIGNQKVAVSAMVMCVADPVLSSHGYRTDLQIDTLQKALDEHGFVADRWWLPWLTGDIKRNPSSGTPGVMLFRGKPAEDGRRRLLVVYLVGELMTSGIDRDALALALDQVAELLGASITRQSAIPILGPVFSGSMESLALTLAARRPGETGTPIIVINFSATAFDAERFRALTGDESILYGTTITSFADQRRVLLDYARGQLGLDRIAWLTEVGTGLAAGKGMHSQTTENTEANEVEDTNRRIDRTLVFPTGIAQVRDAYAKTESPGAVTQLTSPTDRALLRFPTEAQTNARDLVPRFSAGMQGPYAELALRNLLLDIARHDFDAVGITATDHRDRLFLVEQLRRHAPEAQILLVGGDLAFDHPAHRRALLGALVVSAYPPFPAHQLWPDSDEIRRIAFPTQANAALANAVTLAFEFNSRPPQREKGDEIDECGRLLAYRLSKTLAKTRLRHYVAPLVTAEMEMETVAPPVWVSAVGYQGTWPLRWIGPCEESKLVRVRTGESAANPPSTTRFSLQGLQIEPVALTQLTLVLLVLAVLIDTALRGRFRIGTTVSGATPRFGPRHDAWLPSDEWIRPFREWFTAPTRSSHDASDRVWRLGGPLVLTLLGLFVPAVANAIVAWTGVITGAGIHDSRTLLAGDTHNTVFWLATGPFLLAPWRAPLVLRLVLVGVVLVGCVTAGSARWLLVVAILATTAAGHLAVSLVRTLWKARRRAEIDDWTYFYLTLATSFVMVAGLVAALVASPGMETRLPWLLTTAAIFNGISPLLPLTTAGIALAVIWYVELVRSWRADEYPVPPTLGLPSDHDGDGGEPGVIRYPFVGRHVASWLNQQLGWTLVHGSTAVAPAPLGVLHFIFLLGSCAWLVDLAFRLKPIYPSSTVHWACVGMIGIAFLSWVLLLIRTEALVRVLFDSLHAFRREVEKPGSGFRAAFKEMRRPADVALGRTLFFRRPPSPRLDDLVLDRRPSSGYPPLAGSELAAVEKRVIGMKRFVRSLGGQIRWLGAGLAVGAVLLFVASTSLPCQPRSSLVFTSTLSFIAFAWLVVGTLLRIERDPVLNLIAGSSEVRDGWDWPTIARIAVPVAIPVLLVLGQAFPDAWQWVGALVEGWRGS